MRFKPLWIPFLFAVLASSLLVGLGPRRQEAARGKMPITARLSLSPSYGKLPLSFEVNQGQTDRRVRFLSRGHGYTLFLTPTEAVVALSKSPPLAEPSGPSRAHFFEREKTITTALRIKLVGSNPHARLAGMEELPGKSNYFIGNNPNKWRTNVPNYGRVKVYDDYPGVDLMYYGNQRQLEEDFVVAPGADPRAITMEITGAERVSIDAQGELVLASAAGEVRWRKPLMYQEVAGERREIAGGYTLERTNRVGFRVASYDANRPLIVDPVLVYSTYLGGSGRDEISGIAVDASGSAYVTGLTDSANFPTTSGAFQTTFAGSGSFAFLCCDAYVSKLNPSGSGLIYSTYLGGSGPDSGQGIAVDTSGNAYVAGHTESTDFPTTSGAFQRTFGGSGFYAGAIFGDGFVTKLNPTGSGLVYSTYLGGNGFDEAQGIAIDPSGNAYIVGGTRSTNFPTSAALQSTLTGYVSAFITKLNASGSGLLYSTYFNGNSSYATGIAADASGNAYVAGTAECSGSLPITAGAYQTTCGGGGDDIFVAKLDPTGGLLYSTYLGGSSNDEQGTIAVDSSGNAYVTGRTASTDFPVTAGAFQTGYGGSTDTFVSKLNASGNALVYSTYIGGSGGDFGLAIALDASGEAYVAGQTGSTNFPTANPVQPVSGGPSDGFLTKLNAAGSAMLYSTYLGGGGNNDGALGVAVDASGNAYVAGLTNSMNFPMTAGTLQASFGGGQSDGFVAKIATETIPPAITVSASPSSLWPPNGKMVPVTISGSITDTVDGVNAATAAFAVTDEYGSVQPSGSITLGSGGSYSFTISLQASRQGSDKDGRQYTIVVSAQDSAGNLGSASTVVTVPHDQGH
jgi:hypothetical protein